MIKMGKIINMLFSAAYVGFMAGLTLLCGRATVNGTKDLFKKAPTENPIKVQE